MPWKGEIMKHLDRIDDIANVLKACNAVCFDEHNNLCGSNTDWIGIEGALRAAVVGGQISRGDEVAAVVGAGGAARAAVYTLSARFGAKTIYVLNREDDEVTQLINDCKQMDCELLHLKSVERSAGVDTPSVVIGSIPDFEAISSEEKAVKAIFEGLLSKGKGIFLDMCYHPMKTRHIRLAEDHGWQTVSGIEVVGHQVEALWRLWITPERLARVDRDGLWRVLREAAALDSKGRQALNADILKQHFGR
jgi:quinate dehydrogenase